MNKPSLSPELFPERRTARVVLINNKNEILLVKYKSDRPVDPTRPDEFTLWVPIGGGAESGESYEQAAVREVREETGLSVTISHCTWSRDLQLELSGEMRQVRERYFLAHSSHSTIDCSRHAEENILAARWWSIDDLAKTEEIVRPPNLAALLEPLLKGVLPDAPLDISGG